MKNILLDLGTHYGQGLREFITRFKVDSSWCVYTFEANPVTFKKFTNDFFHLTPYVKAYNMAVSNHYGTIDINLETPPNEDADGMGSSVISLENWDPWGNKTSTNFFHSKSEVFCFDLSDFIQKKFSKDDNIVIKMDIEGSEYVTLEKMIEDKTIEYVNHISVEWHSRYFMNKEEIQNRENNLIEKMKNYERLSLESWR